MCGVGQFGHCESEVQMILPEPDWGVLAAYLLTREPDRGFLWPAHPKSPQKAPCPWLVVLLSSHAYKVGVLNEVLCSGDEVLFPEETHQGGPM